VPTTLSPNLLLRVYARLFEDGGGSGGVDVEEAADDDDEAKLWLVLLKIPCFSLVGAIVAVLACSVVILC
jgi:hypothetical protein